MGQYIYAFRIKRTELTKIPEKISLMTAAEKEVFLDEWEWQEGQLDWSLMSTSTALDLEDWLECAKRLISKENHELLRDVFKLVAPFYLDFHFYDEVHRLSPLSTLIWATLELSGFVLEIQHIISLKEKIELLLEEDTLKTIEFSHKLDACNSVFDWEQVKYHLRDLLEFTQQCGDEDVAIIYII